MAVHCCGSSFWLYLLISVGLVLFAGMMSGLTLGLMSLGLVDLEVLTKSGTEKDRKYAAKILPVVKNRHLLLCTLLIGNALAMEALPIFLDELINAWGAVLISVTLILMFGEILPQAVCSRYGLAVGAAMTPVVRLLVILFFPVTYPISKLLDFMLGKSHLALFRRAELMTLVNMHGNEAGKGGELTHDETTIITGALEMTQKTAQDAMMPILTTFSIDVNAKLDMDMMNLIMMKGHSRIPVYSGTPTNIIGLVLVKNLLTLRPEDKLLVRQHATIRKIPRVEANMPLYDILNDFQKGHSHMAAVVRRKQEKIVDSKCKGIRSQVDKRMGSSKFDGNGAQGEFMAITLDIPEVENAVNSKSVCSIKQNPLYASDLSSFRKDDGRLENQSQRGRKWNDDLLEITETFTPSFPSDEEVIGIITMEDVIEELLQEEILDETDEYVDVKSRIKVNMVPRVSLFSPFAQTGSTESLLSSSDQHDTSSILPSSIASSQTAAELMESPLSLQAQLTCESSPSMLDLQCPPAVALTSSQRQTGDDMMIKGSDEHGEH